MIQLKLFWEFLKVGCFCFGGAYGAIPLIREMVVTCGWLTDEQLLYMIAVSESTPGPIMVNLATYVGCSQGGFWGGALATIGVILPSFIIIVLVTAAMDKALKNRYVQAVMQGLKPCIIGMILTTGSRMLLSGIQAAELAVNAYWAPVLVAAILAGIMFGGSKITKKRISPIALIGVAALCGIVLL